MPAGKSTLREIHAAEEEVGEAQGNNPSSVAQPSLHRPFALTCPRVGRSMAAIHITQREDSVAFRVEQIDHVELYVPDQYEAARWYKDVLGFEVLPAYEHWASEGGPLIISCAGGASKLALFKGEVRSSDRTSWYRRVAFRVTGQASSNFSGDWTHSPCMRTAGSR